MIEKYNKLINEIYAAIIKGNIEEEIDINTANIVSSKEDIEKVFVKNLTEKFVTYIKEQDLKEEISTLRSKNIVPELKVMIEIFSNINELANSSSLRDNSFKYVLLAVSQNILSIMKKTLSDEIKCRNIGSKDTELYDIELSILVANIDKMHEMADYEIFADKTNHKMDLLELEHELGLISESEYNNYIKDYEEVKKEYHQSQVKSQTFLDYRISTYNYLKAKKEGNRNLQTTFERETIAYLDSYRGIIVKKKTNDLH